jgi:cellulose 1,4-beta-cellobiosidase
MCLQALYFTGMLADGGQSTEPNNKAGPEYGVGYCDSQCPRDLKFIGGQVSSRHVLLVKRFSY